MIRDLRRARQQSMNVYHWNQPFYTSQQQVPVRINNKRVKKKAQIRNHKVKKNLNLNLQRSFHNLMIISLLDAFAILCESAAAAATARIFPFAAIRRRTLQSAVRSDRLRRRILRRRRQRGRRVESLDIDDAKRLGGRALLRRLSVAR